MSKFLIQADWESVPHLSPAVKAELLASIPAFQREARSRGIPELGAGAIYTTPIPDITVPDFVLPKEWPRVYGLDVGWNFTAAAWAAWDRGNDVVYLTSVYKRGQAEPAVHATAIRARGAWIPGVCDPAAQTSNQIDGRRLLNVYREPGCDLLLAPADNAVEAGLYAVWNRLATGRLKVFASCSEFFAEYGLYRRDPKGKIVKEHDHIMDATRYLIMSGLTRAIVEPPKPSQEPAYQYEAPATTHDANLGWMAAVVAAVYVTGAFLT